MTLPFFRPRHSPSRAFSPRAVAPALTLLGLICSGCAPGEDASALKAQSEALLPEAASDLRLNQLQMLATHNSYHIKPPIAHPEWHYEHDPLDVQLESQGVRGLELDLHYNAATNKIYVYHIVAVDMLSNCREFLDCLQTIKGWSDANPLHHTLMVQFEFKEWSSQRPPAEFLNLVESNIRKVFPLDRLVTPDLVKGSYPDLSTAVQQGGWPRIDDTRGRTMFILQDSGAYRTEYTYGDVSLDGRVMFVDAGLDKPYAAYLVLNDPVGDAAAIAEAVSRGFIVRTRADSCCDNAESNDYTQWEAALASGAQVITTDFPEPYPEWDYWVQMPDGNPSRCNPTTAPAGCTSALIEDLP